MSGWPNLSDLIVGSRRRRAGRAGRSAAWPPDRSRRAAATRRRRCFARRLRRIGRYDIETGREISTRIADRGDVEIAGLSIEQATGPIRDAVAVQRVARMR